jgi:four helix bundle protein
MRRAATSIPANIAEGQARKTTGEFLQSLGIARGSLAELETFLTLSEKLGLLSKTDCDRLLKDCAEINKMIHALMKSLSTPR